MFHQFKRKRKGIEIMRQAKFTRPLTISLSPDVYDVLKEMSDAERISMAECVRGLLAEMVAPYLDRDADQSKSKQDGEEKSNDTSKQ
jgi:predicted CopG family antitoxin